MLGAFIDTCLGSVPDQVPVVVISCSVPAVPSTANKKSSPPRGVYVTTSSAQDVPLAGTLNVPVPLAIVIVASPNEKSVTFSYCVPPLPKV